MQMEIHEKFSASTRGKRSRRNDQSPYFKQNQSIPVPQSMKRVSTVERNIGDVSESFRLQSTFFNQPCTTLAKKLLGKVLARKLESGHILKGRIVETESYVGVTDKASHSYNGKITDRNAAMFMRPGTAYVYSIYGMYFCFNISSLEEGSAVLLRALEPLEGFDVMRNCRNRRKNGVELRLKDLCNGPSKLCQALCIDKSLNKTDLVESDSLWLEEGIIVDLEDVVSCKRIGIDSYGEEWSNKPLRFYIRNNQFVSRRNKEAEKCAVKNCSETD